MKRTKLDVLNRSRTYRYGFYRRTDMASLMKINPALTAPDIALESLTLPDYVIDTGAEGNGLATPDFEISFEEGTLQVTAKENKGVTCYYGVVAFRDGAPVSDMEITSSSLKQDPGIIMNILTDENETPIASFKNSMILMTSQIAEETVPVISLEDITHSLENIIISNDVIINLPNIWYDVNKIYNYRDYKSIRISAVSGQDQSGFKELFTELDKAYLPIHKIEVLRKDITANPSELTPDSPENENVNLQKMIIFRDGVYYQKDYQRFPLNMINRYDVISVFDRNTTLRTLPLKDKVEHEKTYKYTVRLFDSEKRASEPTVLIIRT